MVARSSLLILLAVVVGGCNLVRTRQDVPAKLRAAPTAPGTANPGGGLDTRGIERNDRPGLLPQSAAVEAQTAERPDLPPLIEPGEEIRELRATPDVPDLPLPGEAIEEPAEAKPPLSAGESMPLGGVIARVNGEAIYTDEILRAIRPVLRARSRTLDRPAYERAAQQEIVRQLQQVINDRLALEAARRRLSEREKQFVQARTFQYRQEQITRAGGSAAVADRLAREAGFESFDELVLRKNDELMIDTFRERKLRPMVQVTADEMRRRYQRDGAEMFDRPASAEYRLIRVADAAAGSEVAALDKARNIRAQLDGGADFAEVAATEANDDPSLRRRGGSLGMGELERGSYRFPEVEAAIFDNPAIAEGDVFGPIRVQGGYMIGRVDSLTPAQSGDFGDREVQAELRRVISREKYVRLVEEESTNRQNEAAIGQVDGGMQAALQIALRDYDLWTARAE
jgi:hypothetical protein